MVGYSLLLTHPELPTCHDCQRWMHDKDWRRVKRGDQDVPRPPGTPTPCYSCPKSLDRSTPNPGAELDSRGHAMISLFQQIKAGYPPPDDAIVRQNCGLLRWVEDSVECSARAIPLTLMAALAKR